MFSGPIKHRKYFSAGTGNTGRLKETVDMSHFNFIQLVFYLFHIRQTAVSVCLSV